MVPAAVAVVGAGGAAVSSALDAAELDFTGLITNHLPYALGIFVAFVILARVKGWLKVGSKAR